MSRVEAGLLIVAVLAFVAWVWTDVLYGNPAQILPLTDGEMYMLVSFVAVVLLGLVLGIPDVPDS